MSDFDAVLPYQGATAPLARDSRRAAREISRLEARTQTRLASIDKETDATIAKGQSVTSVTAYAMSDVARIGQLETQLETMAPQLSGRLAMLADSHAMDMAQIKAEHVRSIRRR